MELIKLWRFWVGQKRIFLLIECKLMDIVAWFVKDLELLKAPHKWCDPNISKLRFFDQENKKKNKIVCLKTINFDQF